MQRTVGVPTYPELAGKVAVVTGGTGGIGSATCQLLAANGVKVAVNGRSPEGIAKVVDAITAAGGKAAGVLGDCTDLTAVEGIRQRVEAKFGPADIVAAFVGDGWGPPEPVTQVDPANWQAALNGSLNSTYFTLKVFLPGMTARGAGTVITMGSSAGAVQANGSVGYSAAKAGVVRLTRQVAAEVGPSGVRVNCLVPHAITGASWADQVDEKFWRAMAAEIPLQRVGTPEDVALATLFLASDSAAFITGASLDVTGGYVIA